MSAIPTTVKGVCFSPSKGTAKAVHDGNQDRGKATEHGQSKRVPLEFGKIDTMLIRTLERNLNSEVGSRSAHRPPSD